MLDHELLADIVDEVKGLKILYL